MVDNENQWEDMEYSDAGDAGYDDGYSEDEYSDGDQGYDYDEDYDDEDYTPQKKSGSPIIGILLFLILLGVGGFIAYNKFVANGAGSSNVADQPSDSVAVTQNPQDSQAPQGNDNLADSFFAEAGGSNSDMMSVNFNENGETNVSTGEGVDESVATVTETTPAESVSQGDLFEGPQQEQVAEETNKEDEQAQANDAIMVVYNKAARLNPFKPPVVDKTMSEDYDLINNTDFEIIEPPVSSEPDENLTRLLQTQISGILFDEESPSAIVNLNGMDQFVKAGDVISGYRIDSISRDKVQVSYKNNSYVASVGELFTRGALEKKQAVVNLENKFAGRYKNNN